ncbi:LSU ribosomal protein L23p [Aquipluma nitroreducens]|jgi:large subunit ribosomal protein L23|uniref:Large ribosomal subunit protein uL23 n=1 Tax=Aquipluma nitroreducens TaxID=2010828 RepID=A0A5K7S654_9BACT|nr:50S ribosomal protein L23 [Aquipluma nitroreducens]BBE17028.1 LSU ribosomal protein L23p [Aquipluma nitroreducens]
MEILIKPIVTEKITGQAESLNRYGFIVNRNANKLQIKKAIEGLYNVSVTSVNTLIHGGKRKSRFTKAGVISGSTGMSKKAIVTIAKGESIDFYSNI